jgi:hypothetical protein
MVEAEIINFFLQNGFAIAIAIYLLLTRDKIVMANTEALTQLKDIVQELCNQIKK